MAKFTIEVSETNIKDIAEELAWTFENNYNTATLKKLGYANHKAFTKIIMSQPDFPRAIEEAVQNLFRDMMYDIRYEVCEMVNIPFMNELYEQADELYEQDCEIQRAQVKKAQVAAAKKLLKSEGYAVSK